MSSLTADFLQNSGAWIFLPEKLTITLLDLEKKIIAERVLEPEATREVKGTIIEEMKAEFENTTAKYIKVHAFGISSIPDWHEGAGNKGWLFIDEVVVY